MGGGGGGGGGGPVTIEGKCWGGWVEGNVRRCRKGGGGLPLHGGKRRRQYIPCEKRKDRPKAGRRCRKENKKGFLFTPKILRKGKGETSD